MKIIKLNRKYNVYRWHNHQAGLRFDTYDANARIVEKYLRNIYKTSGYISHNMNWFKEVVEWGGYFGKATKYNPKPYFITFRTPDMITAVLLACPELTTNSD